MGIVLNLIVYFLLLFAIFLRSQTGPYPYGRVPQNEWTEFDKTGRPVRGVGHRGYWVNSSTHGDWPFRDCHCGATDCKGYIHRETSCHPEVMSLTEYLELDKQKKP